MKNSKFKIIILILVSVSILTLSLSLFYYKTPKANDFDWIYSHSLEQIVGRFGKFDVIITTDIPEIKECYYIIENDVGDNSEELAIQLRIEGKTIWGYALGYYELSEVNHD